MSTNEIINVLVQSGVAGVAVYFMYKLTHYVIKKYPNDVATKFEKISDKLSDLSTKIDKLNYLLEEYLKRSEGR